MDIKKQHPESREVMNSEAAGTEAKHGEKFTPGPWFSSLTCAGWRIRGEARDLAYLVHKGNEIADAYLISAAPDMYASLREFMAMRQAMIDLGGTKGPLDKEMIARLAEMQEGVVERAEAALAKARGKIYEL